MVFWDCINKAFCILCTAAEAHLGAFLLNVVSATAPCIPEAAQQLRPKIGINILYWYMLY